MSGTPPTEIADINITLMQQQGTCRSSSAKLLFAVLLLLFAMVTQAGEGQEYSVPIYYFWGDGCPHCAEEKPFLEELERRWPQVQVRDFEVWYTPENRPRLLAMAKAYGIDPAGVPITFIGERAWVGFGERLKPEMQDQVQRCIETGCPQPDDYVAERSGTTPSVGATSDLERTITLPLLGEIDLARHSLWFTTALIAFVDGFNPCSLWVLSMLLAIVIYTGSRKKIFLVGLTFLLVTASAYGVFIAGLFNVFAYVSYLGWIQVLVALLALGFGLINIKDYFWFKKGVSLTISEKHKPKIFKDIRQIMAPDKSLPAMLGATAVMALGITLVELPCTAGFPVLWSNIVAGHEVGTLGFLLLLGLYMLIYLLDELVVFLSAVFTLKASKFEEKQGRALKLIGGMIMLALALVLLIEPELMNSIGGSLLVFAAALLASFAIMLVHRHWNSVRPQA